MIIGKEKTATRAQNVIAIRLNHILRKNIKPMPPGEIKAAAELIHLDFIKLMYPKFGLTEPLPSCPISVKPLLFSNAGLSYENGKFSIDLNDDNNGPNTVYASAHETGHYMHPLARRNTESFRPIGEKDYLLGEIIANLASLVYFNEIGYTKWIYGYIAVNPMSYSQALAIDIFRSDPEKLRELSAAHVNTNEAVAVMIPLLKRPLDFKKDPYGVP